MKDTLDLILAYEGNDIHLLKELVKEIRPRSQVRIPEAISQIENLIALLKAYPEYKVGFMRYWAALTEKRSCMRLLTDTGIQSYKGFSAELVERFSHSFLPPVTDKNSFLHLIGELFNKKNDYKWVRAIPHSVWKRLFEELHFKSVAEMPSENPLLQQVLNGILIISLRINTIALEQDVIERLPELEKFDSPFMVQNIEIDNYLKNYRAEGFDRSHHNQDYKQILIILRQCEEYIQVLRKNRDKYGITLRITHSLLRLSQNIKRVHMLLRLITLHHNEDDRYLPEISFLKEIVEQHNTRNSLNLYVQRNIGLLAYQITEHASKTGDHYITSGRKDYWNMYRSAMKGGLIVGFLSMFKTLFYYLKVSPFVHGLLYSANYSFGFIAIYLFKGTLATKQPAMVATKLAQTLDIKPQQAPIDFEQFSRLIAKVSRSQLVAFIGNVMVSFPVAYGLAWGYFALYGVHIATPEKAQHLIHEIHPWRSLSLFHAGIAGVYLFLSGLISGYYDNQTVSNKIPQRLRQHPVLSRIMPKKWLTNLSNYLEKSMGSLAGNFWLGIFLGSTAILGGFLGLPIDIRHITFAAGNFGLAIVGLEHAIHWKVVVVTILGIIGIGFMNFIVSFGLATFVAIRARGINFLQSSKLLRHVIRYFIKHPWEFVFPPKDPKALPPASSGDQKSSTLVDAATH
ncbi:site-specific recombinase [Eisenibacter elegans]|jgi:site-specific recombinase|uniref:site-specific recombinase n=1 Tax=Eisenibacter elegans TaxID=997 RepID=UPI000420EE91|nr:site-specific recombinase [Eisenibacter elegans]